MNRDAPALSRDLIVVGGSAGSITVLQRVLRELPADLAAAVMVVVHQASAGPGRLPEALGGTLPVRHARDGEPIELGQVYVAPPDYYMMVEPAGRIRLSLGPKQNRVRPAIDPLFRTAARVFGPQVIGLILSGYLDDGTFGLMQVKRFGGVTLCQDPRDAECPDMPASAIRHVSPDRILAAAEMAAALVRLVRDPAAPACPVPPMAERTTPASSVSIPSEAGDIADRGDNALTTHSIDAAPTALTCPQCGGAIWEINDGGVPYYRCHVGHAYSAESMAAERESELEQTLWEALRMFQENAELHRRMAERNARVQPDMAARYRERYEHSRARTELIRRLLLGESDPRGPAPRPGEGNGAGAADRRRSA